MKKNTAIEQLPDFPAIRQIQGALWGVTETRGAAVLIGAGFSRNAVLPAPNSPKPPLWTDFCRIMKERLYPGLREKDATTDPLGLAEEYKAALGPAALESLIYELVRDKEWRPGPLHRKLVRLPWTDILTTNWDTLLESAADVTDREETYDTIRTIADIPRTRAPRIVKLHGSMPSNPPFIFTEEDYRTFPRKFAPFVNLVQQVLMENELCLVGFSGDDPNFLHWSGWIRDQLGDSARRIYLVGVLNLSPARRKYLEARKVTPIDFAPIVDEADGEDHHRIASDLFLDFLFNSKPKAASQWLSKRGSIRSQQLLGMSINRAETAGLVQGFNELLAAWQKEREAYAGWLVCPSEDRTRIRADIGNPEYVFRQVQEHLQTSERAAALYEVIWRLDLAFLPLSVWLRGLLTDMVEDPTSAVKRRQRFEIALILLRIAREERDRPSFERWVTFLKTSGNPGKDVVASIAYEESLWARDHLDYFALAKLVLTIDGEDPAWKIRRAALHYELGEFDKAETLINEVLQEVRERYVRDRKSIWNISRLGWALFLARGARLNSVPPENDDPLIALNEWPDYFLRNKCLPWDELDELDRQISEEFRERAEGAQSERALFDPGAYTTTVRFSSSLGWAMNDTLRLADIIGLPTMAGSVDVMRSRLSRAVELSTGYDEGGLLRSIRIIKGPSDNLIEKVFGRVQVARMPFATVQRLIDVSWAAINFGRMRFATTAGFHQPGFNDFWVDRLRVHVEVLSRLVVRLDGEQAIATFRKAVSLAHAADWRYWALFEPLGNLLSRALLATPPRDRPGLLLDIVNLPLPDERGIQGQTGGPLDEWPEVMARLSARISGRGSDEAGFSARVAVLISKVLAGDPLTRGRAAIRLGYLQRMRSLTPEEGISFGKAVWSKRESDSALPQHTSLLAHVLFDIPGHDKDELTRLFRSNVLDKALSGLVSPDPITEIVGATRARNDGSRAFELTSDEALKLFDLILAWQPRPVTIDLDHYNDKMIEVFGPALSEAILPVLDLKHLGQERIDKLFNRVEAGTLNSVLVALADVVRMDGSREIKAIELLHRGIFSRERDAVVYSLSGIDRWRLLSGKGRIGKVPQRLKQAAITIAAGAREPWLSSALYVAGKLVENGDASDGDKKELIVVLDRLQSETAYTSWDMGDARTVNITHIRAQCVKLALQLRHAGMVHEAIAFWIDGSNDDPVPEVRYALADLEA
jgi:tetratricopeptide (TPR) repeat protein